LFSVHVTDVFGKYNISGHIDRLVKGTDIILHPDNIEREEGFKLSNAWNLSTNTQKHHDNPEKTKRKEYKKQKKNRLTTGVPG
jgi:hypothetical protein